MHYTSCHLDIVVSGDIALLEMPQKLVPAPLISCGIHHLDGDVLVSQITRQPSSENQWGIVSPASTLPVAVTPSG